MKFKTQPLLSSIATLVLAGCSGTTAPIVEGSYEPEPVYVESPEMIAEQDKTLPDPGQEAIHFAQQFIGIPYRYGGSNPSGFDCSGLVQYTYRNLGIRVPRTAAEQYRIARPVSRAELRPGDVIFFRLHWHGVSHVGLYAGNGKFIHAPSTGKHVTYSDLNDPYWSKRIVKVGRFY